MMIENLSRDDFAGQLDTVFTVFFEGDTGVEVRLVEVTELKRSTRTESFSLLFRAPVRTPVVQQMARMEHSELGTLELGLVPIGSGDDGVVYEALFNRLIG